jgi:SanA protein
MSSNSCYDDVSDIPHSTYGLLLGTGRTHDPSPYYDARIQATIDLYQAGKIDYVFISGENNMDGYNEVDEMREQICKVVPAERIICDAEGNNTWASINNFGDMFGYQTTVTIISQKFHNQRAIYLSKLVFSEPTVAYNAQDTNIKWLRIYHIVREAMARTKEVILSPLRIL